MWIIWNKYLLVLDIFIQKAAFSNILSIWAKKNSDKSAILNMILTKLHRIHERIVIGVGDIYPDGQTSDGRKHRRIDGRTEAKSLSPTKKIVFGWGIIIICLWKYFFTIFIFLKQIILFFYFFFGKFEKIYIYFFFKC